MARRTDPCDNLAVSQCESDSRSSHQATAFDRGLPRVLWLASDAGLGPSTPARHRTLFLVAGIRRLVSSLA